MILCLKFIFAILILYLSPFEITGRCTLKLTSDSLSQLFSTSSCILKQSNYMHATIKVYLTSFLRPLDLLMRTLHVILKHNN